MLNESWTKSVNLRSCEFVDSNSFSAISAHPGIQVLVFSPQGNLDANRSLHDRTSVRQKHALSSSVEGARPFIRLREEITYALTSPGRNRPGADRRRQARSR